MSEDGAEMAHRCRRGPSSAAPATPLDDDHLLAQILLRLPPRPSSLPRASLVCKRWRRLLSNPHFLRSFRAHHRKAPLLGFFSKDYSCEEIVFNPTLDSPDRIPATRISLQIDDPVNSDVLGCRHGRILVVNRKKLHFLVWDPITGEQRRVAFPRAFRGKRNYVHSGAVLCAAADQGHVHGGCHSSPFQVILIGSGREHFFRLCLLIEDQHMGQSHLNIVAAWYHDCFT